jgi:hypothetical protein
LIFQGGSFLEAHGDSDCCYTWEERAWDSAVTRRVRLGEDSIISAPPFWSSNSMGIHFPSCVFQEDTKARQPREWQWHGITRRHEPLQPKLPNLPSQILRDPNNAQRAVRSWNGFPHLSFTARNSVTRGGKEHLVWASGVFLLPVISPRPTRPVCWPSK